MSKNISPWLQQIKQKRQAIHLAQDIITDVVVVGAGIAGVATTYHLLKNTSYNVIMVDAGKLAHGATGHNAGQVIAHIERPFADIVQEAGLSAAASVLQGLMDGWEILMDMYTTAGLNIPFSRFTGYDAYMTVPQVMVALADIALKRQAGIVTEQVFLDASLVWELPLEYEAFVTYVSADELHRLIEAKEGGFIAAIGYQKGVINSALFCEEVVRYLLAEYADRFLLFENTPIGKVVFHDDIAILDAGDATLTTSAVVLCTNGFETIRLLTPEGLELDRDFHYSVRGTVSYMTGYLTKPAQQPIAVSYFTEQSEQLADPQLAAPYFYVTRRGYESDGLQHSLVCIGGPEAHLDDRAEYLPMGAPPADAQRRIDDFKDLMCPESAGLVKKFVWHGLMGYTPNGIRIAGQDKHVPQLFYNLGCNGIGILSSVFGGRKVAEEIAGITHEPSLFDPE